MFGHKQIALLADSFRESRPDSLLLGINPSFYAALAAWRKVIEQVIYNLMEDDNVFDRDAFKSACNW